MFTRKKKKKKKEKQDTRVSEMQISEAFAFIEI